MFKSILPTQLLHTDLTLAMRECGSSEISSENKPLVVSICIRLPVTTKVWPYGRWGGTSGPSESVMFTFPLWYTWGSGAGGCLLISPSHDFELIIDHELQPVVEFPGQTHPQDYPGFRSLCIVYGSVWDRVRVWVLRYSMYLDLQETKTKRKSKIRKFL